MSKVILYNDECIHSMNELGDRTINLILTDIKALRLIQFNYSSADFAA